VGSVLDGPTLVLATAAHLDGLPLVIPGTSDEEIGAIGAPVWQIGPSGFDRGLTLARAVLVGSRARVGILASSAAEGGPFVAGFTAGCRLAQTPVVLRRVYARGSASFTAEIRALIAQQVDLLFWEGDAREAAALLRQLMRERVSLRICGGAALAPERQYRETRMLLEGVQYVPDEWSLAAPLQAVLDSVVHSRAGVEAGPSHVRGFLAGRFLAEAVAGGALTPEEIGEKFAAWAAPDAYLRAHGFLDTRREGATLTVHRVTNGR
jgi:ABC-type branched-subunit amino acid transport system substrate-binding protein